MIKKKKSEKSSNEIRCCPEYIIIYSLLSVDKESIIIKESIVIKVESMSES
jgi:hypothetical protein